MKTIAKMIYSAFAALAFASAPLGLQAAPGDLFASDNGTGADFTGSIYQYKPTGLFRIVTSGLSEPRGVAFSRSGNLFVANTTFDGATFQGTIVKITARGVSTVATIAGNFFLEGVAFDSSGNLYVVALDVNDPNVLPSTIYKITPGGVQSTFGSVPGQGGGLAFDSVGNLFAADFVDQTVWKFTPDGTRSVFVGPSAFNANHGPDGLAFDRFGNLFVSETHDTTVFGGNERILKFTPDGMESEFATGLTEPRGLAFASSGNLFVTDHVFTPPGDILRFTPDGVESVFASGNNPELLAFQPR